MITIVVLSLSCSGHQPLEQVEYSWWEGLCGFPLELVGKKQEPVSDVLVDGCGMGTLLCCTHSHFK